ncbi:MAG: L-lactate permease [Oscillibacter sp.]|nr:L-lactate permease [Oscillibacter sp.]
MYALIAAAPILLTVLFMTALNWSAKRSLAISWATIMVIAIGIWKMALPEALARTVAGFLGAFETISIIFGAILLMNILKQSGAMFSINKMFSGITEDARLQAVLVGFCFAGFIEGTAGFGTPAALAAPILISLGFPPLGAACLCLIYNSMPVEPGPVGVPLLTASSVVSDAVVALGGDPDRFTRALTTWTCIPNVIGGSFILLAGIFVLVKIFGKNHSFRDALSAVPFCLMSAGILSALYLLFAFFVAPELVSMLSFIGTLFILVALIKKGVLVPKDVWTFEGYREWGDPSWQSGTTVSAVRDKGLSPLMAWTPYIIIFILLLMTRLNAFGLKTLFNNAPFILPIHNILGFSSINWDFKFFYNPGIMPFILVALATIPLHKMSGAEAKIAIRESFRMISGAAIALCFGVAMVNIYRYTSSAAIGAAIAGGEAAAEYTAANSSMLYCMAHALAELFKSSYYVIAPFIGVLGAFMSGSNTVSNTLFAPLQFETATLVGLSQVLIVALQALGGAIGNMICVNNIVAVCATTGTNGNEGKLIRTNIVPCVLYSLIVAAVVGAALAAGVNPMPELLH